MEANPQILTNLAGTPVIVGLFLAALITFLTSDWRLSLTALLVQYILIGAALAATIRLEVSVVKVLVGVLVVSILYLTARRLQEVKQPSQSDKVGMRFLGMEVRLGAGPLGLPVRFLTVMLAILALFRVIQDYRLPFVDAATALAATWLAILGLLGLILSDNRLRMATALFTILAGFDLVYAQLETSLAIVGFWGALLILTALGFAYLATAQALGEQPNGSLLRQLVHSAQVDSPLDSMPQSATAEVQEQSQ